LQRKLTEFVLLLKVHVNNTARPDTSHLLSIQSADFSEQTGAGSVATVLGEKDGDVVVLKLLCANIEARLFERGVTAPGVDVVTPEVNSILGVATVEVRSQVLTNRSIVVGSVTDADFTVVLLLDVGLRITNGSLDESASNGVVWLVGDFITRKETESVVVLHHLVDNAHIALVEGGRPSWIVTNDRVFGLGQVRNNVDASISERGHTILVVLGRVDGIDTDRVGLKLLEILDVTLA
jgi:hypothetical protein